jgi:Leucine-rich repeat (LRR) protein
MAYLRLQSNLALASQTPSTFSTQNKATAMFRYHPLPSYLLLVTVILAASGRGASLCRHDQSAALLRLKASFRFHPYSCSTLPSWKPDNTNCCTWEGVTCDSKSGYVTALDLSFCGISGNLSSSDIFKLTSLRFLSLAYNNFDATPWPRPRFEQLKDLKYLDLSYSGLSSDLPIENGQLSNLVTLDLSGLHLKDLNLETLIDSLGSLQTLYLCEAYISVNPTDLAHASSGNTTSSLKELRMLGCIITSGHFDTFLTNPLYRSKLANLVRLEFSDFDLKSLSLHSLIGSLGKLQNLYLLNVNISANPTNLAHASSANTTSSLKELSMWGCTITSGYFDTFLTNPLYRSKLANLVRLEFWDFDLKSLSLHSLIGSLGKLQNLFLVNVNISESPIDSAYTSSTNTTSVLKELVMWDCTITSGRLDTVLTKLPLLSNLVILDLSFLDLKNLSLDALINNLGSLQMLYLDSVNISVSPIRSVHASSTNTTPGLQELRMTDCGFTGTFPSWIFHIKSLTVLQVSVSQNGDLCGELPEFIEGSALQELILSGTKFSGKIPESIGNLRNLTRLDLSNCQLNGSIPPFAQWSMIQSIDLSGNNLIGTLPSDGYHALRNLTSIDLSNNSISGLIPASLFSHPSLESLDLSQNNFTRNLILYPNISSSLASIHLSNNKLQGPIPKLLSELVGTYFLDLSSNNFTTVDLSFIKNYKELDYLSLSYNKLSVVEEDSNHSYPDPFIRELRLASCNLSYVPKFLMHQRRIYDLDLSNNNIGGHVPDWIWGIGQSLKLNLSHNLFTSIDTNLSNSSIFDLDLNSNMIEGPIPLPPLGVYLLDYSNNYFNASITPKFWSGINSVVSLSLSHNNLIGEISNLICNATYVGVLDLSFNNFTGLIPPCLLGHNTSLEILNLRGNNLHGSLPQDISDKCALQIMDLNNNKLEGKMPMSLVNCHMLQVLDLGNNLIVDTYPEWLGVLPLLKVLVLKSNCFNGPIDYYGMNKQMHHFFAGLQVLDLSSNYFNGSIPTLFFKQFKAMMAVSSRATSMYVGIVASPGGNDTQQDYRESVTITIKGQETTLVQILSIFMSLDLSNNNFQGIIPNEIGDLKFLKGLNLSRNSFTGEIPNPIANMLQLESLDLSSNQLSGEIPPAMALMSFLEVLNLSYNHLSGMIPQSGQFSTFPEASFLGNDGLCGKPLPRMCDTNHTPSAAATSGSSKELNWEFLSVEAGVVSGLVIVFATTLLWGSGRRWLYWQVDKFLLDVLRPWIRGRRH